MYYGFAADQTSTITTAPTGGTGPYTIVYTMNRLLKCNVSTSAGDETWISGAGTASNTGNVCPTSGGGTNPVSTSVSIPNGGSYAITIKLMADAIITATVTDVYGCVVSDTTQIYAEDVRCFAGNSGNAKVKICHRTNNGCGEICVDQSAVAAHLAHGDFLGQCTPGCIAPPVYLVGTGGAPVTQVPVMPFDVKVSPNPTTGSFKLIVETNYTAKAQVRIVDALGRLVKVINDVAPNSTITFGNEFKGGNYFAEITQGKNRKVVQLVKLN